MKTCPTCRREFPDDETRCPVDEAPLRPAARPHRKRTTYLLAALAAVLILIGASFVVIPLMTGWALSNCEVGFEGFRISGSSTGARDDAGMLEKGREILEGIIGTMTGDDEATVPGKRRVALVLVFRNHNPLAVTIESLDFNLTVNSRRVASGVFAPDGSIRVESGGASEIEVPLSISPGGLVEGAVDALFSRGLEYRLSGRATLKTFIGRVTLPYEFEGANPEINP